MSGCFQKKWGLQVLYFCSIFFGATHNLSSTDLFDADCALQCNFFFLNFSNPNAILAREPRDGEGGDREEKSALVQPEKIVGSSPVFYFRRILRCTEESGSF